jgi:UDP-glucose 4-epimerase
MKQIIVVTGAAGYIGGQISLTLTDAGHEVTGIDRRPCPTHLKEVFNQFVLADFDSDTTAKKLIQFRPDVIIHCAGTNLVGPSIRYPSDYYHNNVIKTIHMLDLVLAALPKTRVIFSSSASVYGEPFSIPCTETDICNPINPYGESKRMIEQVLAGYHRAYNLDYVAFRYFNACGADSLGRHGSEPGGTHIISRVLESIRDNQEFVLSGINYPTNDGTCVRDYVHIEDIANAHLKALDTTVSAGVYNLGNNQGISNLEIIDAAQRITKQILNFRSGPKREGDPAILTASSEKFNQYGSWRKYSLDDMIQHSWDWYVRQNS